MPPPIPTLPPVGIGIDIIHLPRLYALLFPPNYPLPSSHPTPSLPLQNLSKPHLFRKLSRFATHILCPRELQLFQKRFPNAIPKNTLLQADTRPEQILHDLTQEEKDRILHFLSIRWAAKEALYKAYPHPHPRIPEMWKDERVRWKEVELMKDQWGKPYLSITRQFSMPEELHPETRSPEKSPENKQQVNVKTIEEDRPPPPRSLIRRVATTAPYDLPLSSSPPPLADTRIHTTIEDSALLSLSHDGDYVIAIAMYTGLHTSEQLQSPEFESMVRNWLKKFGTGIQLGSGRRRSESE